MDDVKIEDLDLYDILEIDLNSSPTEVSKD